MGPQIGSCSPNRSRSWSSFQVVRRCRTFGTNIPFVTPDNWDIYSLKGLSCCRVTPDVTARWPRVPVSDNCGGFDICSCLPESECVKTVPARNQTKPSHSKVGSNQGPRILYNVSYNCGLTCDEICSILISVGLRSNILGLVRRYFSCWIVVENWLEITFQVWLWWCWYYGPY